MGKMMLTVKLDPASATVEGARERLELEVGELDADFGVVNIDPDQGLYAVLVEEKTAQRLGERPDVRGPFANPPIEPFGPPKPRDDTD